MTTEELEMKACDHVRRMYHHIPSSSIYLLNTINRVVFVAVEGEGVEAIIPVTEYESPGIDNVRELAEAYRQALL